MKIAVMLLSFLLSISWAQAQISVACKEKSKEVKDSCSKDTLAQAFADAFTRIPYEHDLIFKDMDKCTKAVSLCYYTCGNKTLKKEAMGSTVTSALRSSYGKKPHTAEIINCRGNLSDYAKDVELTCKGELIAEKSRMDPKDAGLAELAKKCKDFSGFETPEIDGIDEVEDEYGQAQPPQNNQFPNLGDTKLSFSEVTEVTSTSQAGDTNFEPKFQRKPIKAKGSVAALENINVFPEGEPGGNPDKNKDKKGDGSQPQNSPLVYNPNPQNNKLQKTFDSPKKKARRGVNPVLKKISENIATDVYHNPDPLAEPQKKNAPVIKNPFAQKDENSDKLNIDKVTQSARSNPAYEENFEVAEIQENLFEQNSQVVEILRKQRMTIE